MQLHAQGSGNSCSTDGKLILAQRDLRDIFIASTAELPGLLAAALIMDAFGRKWYAPPSAAGCKLGIRDATVPSRISLETAILPCIAALQGVSQLLPGIALSQLSTCECWRAFKVAGF